MNTSELLVLIFAFLVGYMLYKRCGCIEGATVPMAPCPSQCEIDDEIWQYVDEDKINKNFPSGITVAQCDELKGIKYDPSQRGVKQICGKLMYNMHTFNNELNISIKDCNKILSDA